MTDSSLASPKIAVFTIIARNYIAHASLLVASIRRYHPNWEIQVFFIDDLKAEIEHSESFNISDIELPRKDELSLKYSILEYSTAVKPWVFAHLFKKNYDHVLYFDPDILLYSTLTPLVAELKAYDAVVTPHVSSPYTDNSSPDLRDFLKVGIYNLGFLALSRSKATREFVNWWGIQLLDYGFSNPEDHQFTDQKWMDFAPAFVKTKVLRSDGYNIAYWNLHEYLFSEKSIKFIHFSGFSSNTNLISKYQNRYHIDNIGKFSKYYQDYYRLLEKKKHELSAYYNNYIYPYDVFPNSSIRIGHSVRHIYDYLIKRDLIPRGNFSADDFHAFLLAPSDHGIPNLLYYLYKSSSDIGKWITITRWRKNTEVKPYLEWFFKHGFIECGIDRKLVLEVAKKLHVPRNSVSSTSFNALNIIFLPIDQFLASAYKSLLFRNIDEDGLDGNIKDYEEGVANKFTILFKIMTSYEYREKNDLVIQYYVHLSVYAVLGALPMLLSKLSLRRNPSKFIRHSNKFNFGLNIAGYFTTESGVADSARGIVSALDTAVIPTNLLNVQQNSLRSNNTVLENRFSTKNNYFANLSCVNADQTVHVQKTILPNHYLSNKYNIGYWYWESNIFPSEYFQAFSSLDEIWVATDYIHDVISQVSSIPVVKIPPAFCYQKARKFSFTSHGIRLPHDAVLALQLFDSSSFVERKNPLATFEAFKIAVKANPKLHLLIKTTKIKDNIQAQKQFDAFKESTPNVHFIDGYLEQHEIESLIQSCQIYISLHRSEGLGIPLIKAMLAGIPTIATDFGGNRDFMNSKNSFPIGYTPYILAEDIGPYKQGTRWAEADYEEAGKTLLELSRNPTSTSTESIREYFSDQRISQLISYRLTSVFH